MFNTFMFRVIMQFRESSKSGRRSCYTYIIQHQMPPEFNKDNESSS